MELDAALDNNYNDINSMATRCGNDIIKDLNTTHDHFRTRQDLEDYKDAKGECSVTSESCHTMSFDDSAEVNYDSFKEESIKIEEHEGGSFIKSEMLDTDSDAEISCNLGQWPELENGYDLKLHDCNRSTQKQDFDSNYQPESVKTELEIESNVAAMQSEYTDASAILNNTVAIFLPESSNSDYFEEHIESSGKNSTKYSGLLRQYNNLDPMNYNANVENCNSSTTYAESFTKQGNCVTKSQVGVVTMKPSNCSSSVGLLRQRKGNVTKIADHGNIHSIKRRFKSSIKSQSRINQRCKRANRKGHQKEKNINEKIVAKSERHSELLRDCRVVLTRMDVMNSMETQVKKYSHLKCDMNTGEKPYRCDQCEYACAHKSHLTVHMRKHTGKKQYKCHQCDYACSRKDQLMVHMRKHTGEKPYKCHQCDYACTTKSMLMVHMRKHTGEKPYKCDQCEYACSAKSNLGRHIMRKHTGEKAYKCDQCDYVCSTKRNLERHMRKHRVEKPYRCDQCDYVCSRKDSLIVHMRNHTGEKPYKCDHCNYAYSAKKGLIVHMRKHTGEKPYKCDECHYACTTKSMLMVHMRKHTGEKPYKCDQCDYACSRKDCLIVHMRNHTGEKYKCDQCNYACSTKGNLKIHMRKHI